MKVWFASSGDYSEYRVDQVFASRETAERYVEVNGHSYVEGGDDGIEVRDSLPEPIFELALRCTVTRYGVEFEFEDRRGWFPEVDDEDWRPRRACEVDIISKPSWVGRLTDSTHEATVSVNVVGYDEERVRKVYTERKARALAEFDILSVTVNLPALIVGAIVSWVVAFACGFSLGDGGRPR